MTFSLYVYIAICVLLAMYLTIFWRNAIKYRKIICSVSMLISVSFISLTSYFVAIVPLPAITEEDAVKLAINELDKLSPQNDVKDLIAEINDPGLTLWYDRNGNDLFLYHIMFVLGDDNGKWGLGVTVNASTGKVYDFGENHLGIKDLNKPIDGTYESMIFRLKNIALKIKLRANHIIKRSIALSKD